MRITRTTGALVAAAAALTLGLTACGTDGDDADATSTTMLSSESAPAATSTAPAATDLIGPGCAAYAEADPTGPASLAELAKQPVATAAGEVPMLTTLTAALSGGLNPEVNLVDTLNDGQFTVFAPVDTAFEKLDAATVDKLKTDSTLLTSILTYHVVSGQVAPADAVGTHTTVEGAELTVTAEGDDVKVDDATVVCGGIQTANAKVYLIDSVLMPPMS